MEQFSFEGIEKVLEIIFTVPDLSTKGIDKCGLCSIDKSEWQETLDIVNCRILDEIENCYGRAYLLSESSLFVYNDRIIIKTCGTTTLLLALPRFIQMAQNVCLNGVESLFYSRKGFMFPEAQNYPHRNWIDEVNYIKDVLKDFDFEYKSVVAEKNDDWSIVICTSKSLQPLEDPRNMTLEIQMSEIDPCITDRFWKSKTQTIYKSCGISRLYPNALISDYTFDPCGYSLNGLLHEFYFTIHVTPENDCSYVSFETSVPVSEIDSSQKYSLMGILQENLKIFKPGAFSVSLVSRTKFEQELQVKDFRLKDFVSSSDFKGWNVYFYSFEQAERLDPIGR